MPTNAKTDKPLTLPLQLLLIFTGVAYALMYATRPMLQDDLAFFRAHSEWIATHSPAFLHLPTHVIGSWLSLNGRLGDALNILWLNFLPRPLLIVLTGLMVWAFFSLFVRWTRRLCPGVMPQYLAAALLMFAFPWWDNSQLLVIAFNYVWSSAFMLAWLAWLFRRPRPVCWPACLAFGFFACAQHEALGVPVALALACAMLHPRGILGELLSSREARISAVGGMTGGLYTILSPALWSRASGSVRENSPIYVLLSSDWALIPLIILFLMLISLRRRHTVEYLRSARGGISLFFAIAACASGVLSMYSGIVGRTGAFAQIFAFLAIFGLVWPLIPRPSIRVSPAVSGTVCLLLLSAMAIHISALTHRQIQLNREASEVISAFREAPDNPVYYDIPSVADESWWLLGKAAGLPPCYDPWHEEILRRYIGSDSLTLIVFPEAWRAIPLESLPVITLPDSLADMRLIERGDTLFFLSRIPHATPGDSLKRIPVPTALRPGDRIATMNR
ncbi:MAG: hypothetical protein K2L96_01430 [Muribaculaceae bacterium]|nr:hypothetical protein [Muribaculaceae bacterium]